MSDMTMVERVARAIYEARNGQGCKSWRRCGKAHQKPYLADARAAVGEMRAPTDAMYDAAERDPGVQILEAAVASAAAHGFKLEYANGIPPLQRIWRAMIDAALSEQKP